MHDFVAALDTSFTHVDSPPPYPWKSIPTPICIAHAPEPTTMSRLVDLWRS